MKRIFIITMLLMMSKSALSGEWISPIEKKYKEESPELYSKFVKASDILDSWRGVNDDLIKADDLLRGIINKDKDFAPAYRAFGRMYIMAASSRRDSYAKEGLYLAKKDILRSIKIEPKYAESYILLGHLYTKMKLYKEAEQSLNKAETIGTESIWLSLKWAELYLKEKQYLAALERYKSVIEKGTSNKKAYASALYSMTLIYRKLKQYDKANEWFKKLIAYEPKTAWSWEKYAGFLLFDYNDVDGAIENGEKAMNIMDYTAGRFIFACALYTKWAMLHAQKDQSKKKEGEKYYEKAMNLYPYLENIIKITQRYDNTKITALSLQKRFEKENNSKK